MRTTKHVGLNDLQLSTCCKATIASGGSDCCASSFSRKVSGATERACGGGIAACALEYMLVVLRQHLVEMTKGPASNATRCRRIFQNDTQSAPTRDEVPAVHERLGCEAVCSKCRAPELLEKGAGKQQKTDSHCLRIGFRSMM